MLGPVQRPSAYPSAVIGNGVVAVGRAVADDGWAGVCGMATLPHARGKGAARNVLAALADGVGAHEADRRYLRPALRLYERTGFAEVCGYHYRTPRMNHVICPWRITVYDLGVLDALADLPA